jgi:hypothetical protein
MSTSRRVIWPFNRLVELETRNEGNAGLILRHSVRVHSRTLRLKRSGYSSFHLYHRNKHFNVELIQVDQNWKCQTHSYVSLQLNFLFMGHECYKGPMNVTRQRTDIKIEWASSTEMANIAPWSISSCK